MAPTSLLQIESGLATDKGRRSHNEDYAGLYFGTATECAQRGIVAAIADGVGGSKGGRVAAELAVRQFIDGYYSQPATLGVQRAAGRVVEALNRWVHAQGRLDPALHAAATTFAALILQGRRAHVLSVGDSRIYVLQDGTLTRLTTDHTLSQPDLNHVLYRAVGIEASVRLDYAARPLRPHDRFLLCTDGVHGALGDRALRTLLQRRSTPQEDADRIVEAALAAGSHDNATVLVVDVLDLPAADHAELNLAFAAQPVADMPETGTCIDGFMLVRQLADGRYGRLFMAEDLHGDRSVVLKFPKPEAASIMTHRAAFVREAWIAARLRSPFVGETIELPPERQTCLYSVMPFYDGETLEARLTREPPLSLEDGLHLGLQLAKGIAALHRAGIVHRDIKPENIILEKDGGLKLIDLGAARLPYREEVLAEDIPGTPSYMAPELFAGQPGDEGSDIFALGVTLYRAFARVYPYGEVEPFSHPRFGRPAPLSRHRPDLPAWLDATLSRAIALNPKERPGDAIEFALELENGFARGTPKISAPVPIYHRNPLLFWKLTSALLAVGWLTSHLLR
ncbi:MAG TPA: bifunctional protein-serine/threonine kinase/phosphatase [Pedomonas sp.]|uniref:bifunctional protein-serine/threonine kinase/phosphatase n=1 Tax=Pedomonas sp. TaxID=2976421 RepID=UPI002F3E9A93